MCQFMPGATLGIHSIWNEFELSRYFLQITDTALDSIEEHWHYPAVGHTLPPAGIWARPGLWRKKNAEPFLKRS